MKKNIILKIAACILVFTVLMSVVYPADASSLTGSVIGVGTATVLKQIPKYVPYLNYIFIAWEVLGVVKETLREIE